VDTEADLEPPTPAGVEPDAIAVLLVDDHDVILDGLTAMLRSYAARVQILGRARTGAEALTALSRGVTPDVVLLDVKLRAESGLDLCRELLHRSPEVKVVFFTVYDDEQYLFQALRMGASGYLLKQTRGAELVDHLEAVIAGEIVIDTVIAARVALAAARLDAGEFWPGARLGLTQRESEVLELVVRGLSNRAIAAQLVVGDETVKSHVSALYRKLGVGERSQAVALALREGLFH